ncbi:MAG: lipocalin family protein [Nannocystaceae bacterium]
MSALLRRVLPAVLCLLLPAACAKSATEQGGLPPLQTVEQVELSRYLGTWYEIASYPQRFQKGCTATTATYSLPEGEDEIEVLNRCRKDSLDGKLDEAKGRARIVDSTTNAKLEVSFFGPFWGDYWIIDLDPDYQWAVVGHPGRDYLWILSRTPQLEPEVYDGILQRLLEQDYDTSRLVETLQPPA